MSGRLTEIAPLIDTAAARCGLDPDLVAAVVVTESAAQSGAARYEAGYRWLYRPAEVKPRTCSLETEEVLQRTSWGLMQVMGAVAREHGLTGWLTRLCRPEVGLEYGCRHLAWLRKRFGPGEAAVSAYNQGSPRRRPDGGYRNQAYVDQVMTRARRLAARRRR